MNKYIEKKTEGLITGVDYKRTSVKIAYWLNFLFLIICSIIALAPLLYAMLSGFKELDEYYAIAPKLLPEKFDLSKVTVIVKRLNFVRAFINTMIIFAGSWFASVIVTGITGYTISRLKPRGSRMFFKIMLWTMMLPHTLTLVPMFMTWTNFPVLHINFQNTFIPFWIGGFAAIWNILLYKNYFDGIPNSYIESAKLDGCTNLGIFAKIIVPLSKPIISTLTVFSFNGVWNDFMGPFLYLKKSELATVALRLYQVKSQWTEPEQMLAAFIVLIPAIIVFAFCSKQIMGNSLSVGVKE